MTRKFIPILSVNLLILLIPSPAISQSLLSRFQDDHSAAIRSHH